MCRRSAQERTQGVSSHFLEQEPVLSLNPGAPALSHAKGATGPEEAQTICPILRVYHGSEWPPRYEISVGFFSIRVTNAIKAGGGCSLSAKQQTSEDRLPTAFQPRVWEQRYTLPICAETRIKFWDTKQDGVIQSCNVVVRVILRE
jgi:hypothetical protein